MINWIEKIATKMLQFITTYIYFQFLPRPKRGMKSNEKKNLFGHVSYNGIKFFDTFSNLLFSRYIRMRSKKEKENKICTKSDDG